LVVTRGTGGTWCGQTPVWLGFSLTHWYSTPGSSSCKSSPTCRIRRSSRCHEARQSSTKIYKYELLYVINTCRMYKKRYRQWDTSRSNQSPWLMAPSISPIHSPRKSLPRRLPTLASRLVFHRRAYTRAACKPHLGAICTVCGYSTTTSNPSIPTRGAR
jgi:hypothetical protein